MKRIRIGKECGGKWFPFVGYGYWDGVRSFLQEPINLKLSTWLTKDGSRTWAVGPLMFWIEESK